MIAFFYPSEVRCKACSWHMIYVPKLNRVPGEVYYECRNQSCAEYEKVWRVKGTPYENVERVPREVLNNVS